MNLIKFVILQLPKNKHFTEICLDFSLRMHNVAYQLAGTLGIFSEPDRQHPKHRLTKYHDWFKKQIQPDWKIVDIGCGNGALAYDLSRYCKFIKAVDINKRNIEIAKNKFSAENIEYLLEDATKAVYKDKFDAIILSNVLEHIEFRVEFLKAIFAHQRSDKAPVLLLRVPMLTRDWITLLKKERGINWKLDPTHFTEYSLEQIKEEITESGLRINKYDIQFGEFFGVISRVV
jgi:SAM-dependent methyltransferase